MKRALLTLSSLALLSALVACEDKPKETKAAEADAGRATAGAVDPKLAEAVAAAGTKAGKDDASAAAEDGPPEKGVFEPGKADIQLKRGEPPKIALGEAGGEPRAVLAGDVPPGWKQSGTLDVTLRLGRAQLPSMTISVSIEAPKPKAPAPAAPGGAPAPAAAPAEDGALLSAKVTEVKLTADTAGPQGKELAAQLAKIKGSGIEFRMVSGVGTDFSLKLAKGAAPDLEMILRAVAEALESATIGFPKEAVGPGGYWLVTTRGMVSGAEVVSYRLVKLEKVAGEELTFSVNTKRYSVSTKLEFAGLPPGAELDQFQSTTEAKLTLHKGEPLASSGTSKQTFAAALVPAGGGDQRLGMQSIADVAITLGKK